MAPGGLLRPNKKESAYQILQADHLVVDAEAQVTQPSCWLQTRGEMRGLKGLQRSCQALATDGVTSVSGLALLLNHASQASDSQRPRWNASSVVGAAQFCADNRVAARACRCEAQLSRLAGDHVLLEAELRNPKAWMTSLLPSAVSPGALPHMKLSGNDVSLRVVKEEGKLHCRDVDGRAAAAVAVSSMEPELMPPQMRSSPDAAPDMAMWSWASGTIPPIRS